MNGTEHPTNERETVSAECRPAQVVKVLNALPLDVTPNDVEHEASAEEVGKCLAKIKEAWTHLGKERAHFSVLTDEKYLPENLDSSLASFYESGEHEALQNQRVLARHGMDRLEDKTCVEYGCGCGRVTMPLAKLFKSVHAYDISHEHLAYARKRASEIGVENISFHLLDIEDSELERCDFLYSRIVFQHNPPPVIAYIIRKAVRSLKAGGIAIFQVPTYYVNYRFKLKEWLAQDHALDIQMHCLPQNVIFDILQSEGISICQVREDNSCGDPELFISNTFVVRKTST